MPRSAMSTYNQKSEFGKIVSMRLCTMGKNQKWLAEQCDVTPAHISSVLSGKAKPSNGLLHSIASELEISVSYLIYALFEAS